MQILNSNNILKLFLIFAILLNVTFGFSNVLREKRTVLDTITSCKCIVMGRCIKSENCHTIEGRMENEINLQNKFNRIYVCT